MVFIFEKQTGEIKCFYTNNISQIGWYFKDNPSLFDVWDEYIVDDDLNVINNINDYRIITVNGKPITYAKKPTLKLSVDKNIILSDGIDTANITLELSNLHPLEEQLITEHKYCLDINGQKYETTDTTIPITSEESDMTIIVSGDKNKYITNTVEIGVI